MKLVAIRRALIVGSGIGGLVCALALHQAGYEVFVFERARNFDDATGNTSGGIQLSPNAMRILARLGLTKRLAPFASEPIGARIHHANTGKEFLSVPLRARARRKYGAPYWQFYRPDLLSALHEAVQEAGIPIFFDHRVSHYSQERDMAHLYFDKDTPKNIAEHIAGHVIVAADGLHSQMRAQILGDTPPRFGGAVAWRGVVAAKSLPPHALSPDAHIWLGRNQHFVAYHMRANREDALINFVAVQARPHAPPEERAEGDLDELRACFADWHKPVGDILAAAEHCTLWGLYDRAPANIYCDGRIALLGDAAHPALPFAAQGAAMAIEDADALASALRAHKPTGNTPERTHEYDEAPESISVALLAYNQARRARTHRIQKSARAAMRLYHAPYFIKRAAFATNIVPRQMEKIYSYK